MEKRFQECNWLQKIWRYRWYVMIPIWYLRSILFLGGYRNHKLIWSILVGEVQLKMKWYYTMEEVFENLDSKIENYGKKITKENIKEAVEYVFNQERNQKPKERKFKLMSYCRGIDGLREYGANMKGLCGHPECVQCRNFEKAFKEEIEKQVKINNVKNLMDENFIDFFQYGKSALSYNNDTFKNLTQKEISNLLTSVEYLSASDVIKKYENNLTEEQINELKNYGKSNDRR